MINLFKHNIGQKSIDKCVETLRSSWHTAGPVNEEVESLISDYYSGAEKYYCALTNSCTAGLMALALDMGIKPGDEIITSPMTFTATAASAMHYGAKPVFVDIDLNTGLIDVEKIESHITKKTKAIYVVNLYGHMPDMIKIRNIADKHSVRVIEDCAHAFDSSRDGYRPAAHSYAACFSFYATKNTHCGEGGAVISKNKALIDNIKIIRRHGLSKIPYPGQLGNMGYDVTTLGFKGVMSDIQASLLIDQIDKTDVRRETREYIAQYYHKRFKPLKNITCLMPHESVKSSWYTFPILVKNRSSLIQRLRKESIGHTIMYPSLEGLTLYGKTISCHRAFNFGKYQLSLPCYNKLTLEELKKVVRVVEDWDRTCS